jgi:ABC-type sugar transport system permease subunit
MRAIKKHLVPYLFISPFFIGYAIFFVYPLLRSFSLSFYQQLGVGGQPVFVGLENYVRLFSDELFLKSTSNTFLYALGSILVTVPLALGLALLITTPNLRFREFFRLLFFTPYLTSGVVAAVIFAMVFNQEFGLINNFLLKPLTGSSPAWLLDPRLIVLSVLIMLTWKYAGFQMLYFSVGLQNISPSYREAAVIDGANSWQVFRFVTLPLLRPVMVFVLTLVITGAYHLFAEPVVLLSNTGGPNNAGLSMTMHMYNVGFLDVNMGYAAAIGYAIAAISIGITLAQFFLLRGLSED